MGYVNKVIIVGNLGLTPELKQTNTGKAFCHLRIATNEVFKDRDGKRQEKTEWHRVTVWQETAHHCVRYLSKGQMVYIEGRIEHRSWEDEDKKKRWSTDVIANRVIFLSGGERERQGSMEGLGEGERRAA
jgi:single-strand DNA-binding protein